ncbi:MAG TPA: CAP domain-containing protein [Cytophagales bacterium]|nr:CAP domain-containing protein [Cytophagales bacterium]
MSQKPPNLMKSLILVFTLLNSVMAVAQDACLNDEEYLLYNLITEYRKTKKLPKIPYSAKLTQVAQAHTRDLETNYTYHKDTVCNLHSWSSHGNWSPCCYSPDHKQANCMWAKPREIANYAGDGYEIAYIEYPRASAQSALAGWKKSTGHNQVITNQGIWTKEQWKAIGIGISDHYAVVWFGKEPDKSTIRICD